MSITEYELNEIKDEALRSSSPDDQNTLAVVAYRIVTPVVSRQVSRYNLRGRGCEDDIIQETVCKIVKNIYIGFLLKPPAEKQPQDLQNWMAHIARTTAMDYCNAYVRKSRHTVVLDDTTIGAIKDDCDERRREHEENTEKLKKCVEIIFACNSEIYISITWICVNVLMYERGCKKFEAIDRMAEEFAGLTLGEMYKIICRASERIEWLKISPEINEKILQKLRKMRTENVTYSETVYRDFFMKSGGKKSISDWMNRMNTVIKRNAASSESAEDDVPKGNNNSREGRQ